MYKGELDLWDFLQKKSPYGFADRREELTLETVIERLEYAMGLEYDRETNEWTGASADVELFTKYAAKLMELDFGGCFWDW